MRFFDNCVIKYFVRFIHAYILVNFQSMIIKLYHFLQKY